MKVKWHKKSDGNTYDITNFAETVNWSGSDRQAARSLEVGILYSPLDFNIKDPNINIGDRLELHDDNKLLIDAMVYGRARESEQGATTYSGYDDMHHLLRSNGTYNFKNTTPEKITKKVCNDLLVEVGKLEETKINIKKLLVDGSGYYDIIMRAYTKANRINGKKYMPIVVGRKLYVIEKGEVIEGFILNDKVDITTSSYAENIDSMVNRVKVFSDKGKQISEVKDKDWMDSYGVFQDVYVKEDGVNAYIAAKNMLVGIEKIASVEARGNIECISGYGVKIKDSVTGITGKFWITNDSHTWENGIHTMSLDLEFKNTMDKMEDE